MDWGELHVTQPVYPDNGVAKGLTTLLQNKAFADMKDFIIRVNNKEFKVHKIVIVSASHYFNVLLEYADAEGKDLKEAEIDRLNPLAVSNLIDYIYTNEITETRADPADLLEAASFLQIPPAIKMAAKFMKEAVNKENCLDYLQIFELYSLTAEAMYTRDFIQDNFEDIFRAHPLNTQPYEVLLELVQLWASTEWELFKVIKQWYYFDKNTRAQHFDSLMHQVRFELMTLDELESIKELQIYLPSDKPWTSLVDRAINYHDLPMHQKVISPHNKVRQQPTPVVFSALESDDNEVYALQKDGKWQQLILDYSPDLHNGTTIVINNFLIVCQASSQSQTWHIFDPRTLTWSTMAEMNDMHFAFALAHDGYHLYAMGGKFMQPIGHGRIAAKSVETDSMVKYNFESDSWSDMNTKLPIPCHGQYTCYLDGFIYMASGLSGHREVMRRLDRFDPSKEIWETRAPMVETRPCFSMNVLTLQGEEFIHVMNNEFRMQYYNPRTDQWSLWIWFADMKSDLISDTNHRADRCVLAHKDTLFLLNFYRDIRVEYVIGMLEAAGCAAWSVRHDSRHVTQRHIDDFPLYDEALHAQQDDRYFVQYLAGLLAFPRALPPE